MATKRRAPVEPALTIPPPSALAALPDSQVGLTEVLKLLFPNDAALGRAIERLRRLRHVEPAVEFDGLEAVFQSHSQGDFEYHRVGLDDDGQEPTIACSCPGRGHPWCVHRLRFRLELAELALRDPVDLLERVMSQAAQLYGTLEPAPAPAKTWRMPEASLPPSLLGGEPPPPTDADRGGPAETPAAPERPRLAGAQARVEVEALLSAIEEEYPL